MEKEKAPCVVVPNSAPLWPGLHLVQAFILRDCPCFFLAKLFYSVGLLGRHCSLRSIHRFLSMFSPGDYEDHGGTFSWWLLRWFVLDFEVCLGTLSICHLLFYFAIFTDVLFLLQQFVGIYLSPVFRPQMFLLARTFKWGHTGEVFFWALFHKGHICAVVTDICLGSSRSYLDLLSFC